MQKHIAAELSMLFVCLLASASIQSAFADDAAQPAAASQVNANSQKTADATDSDAITGTPRADSPFVKLKIGMQMDQVQDIMGHAPDRTNTYETGKRWIPFYFGSDARRLEALYKHEGCLTFTNGNVGGAGGGDLIHIEYDSTGKCFKS